MNVTTTWRQPGQFPRRVLLTISGLSPQVITETLFALAARPNGAEAAFVPTEVHVLTTTQGASRVRQALLDAPSEGGRGIFNRLITDYALPAIRFDERHVHLVRNASGQPLADIRTEDDNALMADAITELVRQFSADPQCALHVSLAGGRKTMGFYAGYALSLLGREQDRLSHVLVSEGFESQADFFYPAPRGSSDVASGATHATASHAEAEVGLALIPFVRLRHGLPQSLLDGRSSFAETVTIATASLKPPELLIDANRRTVQADGIGFALPPMQFALLTVLAQRAKVGSSPLPAPLRDCHDGPWAEQVLHDLRCALGLMHIPDGVEESLNKDCSGNKISPHLSRLRKLLRERLAPGRDALYFDDGGTQRNKRYHVPLPASAIHIATVTSQGAASLPKP